MARPRKIGESERKQVIAIVKSGGSLADAAGIIEVTAQTVRNAMKADPGFLRGVRRAQKEGKMRLVKRVGTAKAWQAAAWMLERKYGSEYGRRHSDNAGVGSVTVNVTQISEDDLVRIATRGGNGTVAASPGASKSDRLC